MSEHCIVEMHEALSPALRALWLQLLARCGWSTPFEHPDWISTAAAMSAGESCPLLLIAREPGGGTLRGVLPLGRVIEHIGPLRLVTIRSMSLHRHDLTTVLTEVEWADRVNRAFAGALTHLVEGGAQVLVRGIPVSEPLLTELGGGWEVALPSPVREADLEGASSWQDVIRDGHQRREIGRAGRKLARDHGWAVHWASTERDARDYVQQFFRMYALQQDQRDRLNPFVGPTVLGALEARLAEWVPKGFADIGMLRVGGIPIAAYILFHSDRHTWAYRTSFVLEWGRYAPGSLMLAAALDRSIARGSVRYDFGWGDQAYKRHWSDVVGETVQLSWSAGLRRMPFKVLPRLGLQARSVCAER